MMEESEKQPVVTLCLFILLLITRFARVPGGVPLGKTHVIVSRRPLTVWKSIRAYFAIVCSAVASIVFNVEN